MRIMIFLWAILACTSSFGASKTLLLENDRLKAEFNASNGALISLVNKDTGWRIVDRAVLGQSFELVMPLTDVDTRYNVVKGVEQKDPVIRLKTNEISFTWRGLRSGNMTKTVDVTFCGVVRLTDAGLEYSGELTNDGPYPIEYISWPCLGEVSIPDKTQPLLHTSRGDSRQLFPRFFNEHGYWGVDYPTSTYQLTERSFVLVNNKDQGFVLFSENTLPKNLLIASFELLPGFEIRDMNPCTDEIDGEMVRIQCKANQVVYNTPGEKSVLNPVKLCLFKGTWSQGLDLYKQESCASRVTSAAWLGEPRTWQKISIGNGSELLRYAKESSKLGVEVLQVRGWYGNGNGTIQQVDGLTSAIQECQKMGIRIILETNWTAVDSRSQLYKDELNKYIMMDPFGFTYDKSYLCPLSKQVQQKIYTEWSRLPALAAADGFINHDNDHRNKTILCFDPKHGHKVGEPTANGTMVIDREMVERIKGDRADKVAMGFGFLDQQTALYDGYQISVSEHHFAKHRYLNPAMPIIATVDVRTARRDMNQALMNRFNMAYDLRFHSNNLADYPYVVSYGRAMEAFREKYAAYIWDATFVETKGASVQGHDLSYSVFVNKNGKRSVVVINNSVDQVSQARVQIEGAASQLWASPENPVMQSFVQSVEIQPQSAVVIFEK